MQLFIMVVTMSENQRWQLVETTLSNVLHFKENKFFLISQSKLVTLYMDLGTRSENFLIK